jgi:hypothetical protein
MNEVDRWIFFDGPEPAHLRPVLDALRAEEPATPADQDRLIRGLLEKLDGATSSARAAATAVPVGAEVPLPSPQPSVPPVAVLPAHGDDPPCPLALPALVAVPTSPPGVATAPAEELSDAVKQAMGRLPFGKPGAVPARKAAPKTAETPRYRRELGGTVTDGDDAISKAVAAVPFNGCTAEAIVTFPNLTLDEYTSLCAELAVSPQDAPAILRRYQVLSTPSRRALDEHWQEQLAEHPAMRETFERNFAVFAYWVRVRPR